MAKLTFSFSNQAGDIPTYEFTKEEIRDEHFLFISEQLELSDDKVFVCFPSFKGQGVDYSEDYKKQHLSFYITNDTDDVEIYFFNYQENYGDYESMNFNFFGFKTYEDAFEYCIDLKEGL
jgi:hypothetical protein